MSLAVARGDEPADTVIHGGKVLSVFTREWLEQARRGQRQVYFVDAAHFVYGTFLCCLWSRARIFVKAASGRLGQSRDAEVATEITDRLLEDVELAGLEEDAVVGLRARLLPQPAGREAGPLRQRLMPAAAAWFRVRCSAGLPATGRRPRWPDRAAAA